MTARGTSRFDRGTVTKNIEAILKLEEDDERQLSPLHRLSHQVGWFVGTIYFVIIQAVFVFLWLLWNIFTARSFDPYPFPLLSAVLAFEAVFLTSFVLIRQNSMDRQSERRNHLGLQINLLAEKEATSILKPCETRHTCPRIPIPHRRKEHRSETQASAAGAWAVSMSGSPARILFTKVADGGGITKFDAGNGHAARPKFAFTYSPGHFSSPQKVFRSDTNPKCARAVP